MMAAMTAALGPEWRWVVNAHGKATANRLGGCTATAMKTTCGVDNNRVDGNRGASAVCSKSAVDTLHRGQRGDGTDPPLLK